MRFLPGRRLLLHVYLSPPCEGAACGDGRTCHLDGCIDVARAACSFVALPDNGSDIACANPVGMDAGVVDASPGDDAGLDAGPDGGLDAGPPDDAGPVECLVDEDCVDPDPCTIGTCTDTVCSFEMARTGTPCEDGLYCNGVETCRSFGCGAGTPVVCPAGRVCDEGADACVGCARNMDCELPGTVSACTFPGPCATVGSRTSSTPYGTCAAGVCNATVSTTIVTTMTCSRPRTTSRAARRRKSVKVAAAVAAAMARVGRARPGRPAEAAAPTPFASTPETGAPARRRADWVCSGPCLLPGFPP